MPSDTPGLEPTAARPGSRWLPVLVLVLLACVPLADCLLPLAGITPQGRRYSTPPLALRLADAWKGTLGEKIEDYFLARSFIRHGTGALYNEAVYRFTGRVPGVTVGREGWLFVQEQTTEIERSLLDRRVAQNLAFIQGVQDRFKALGIPLYLTLVPDRPRLFAARWSQDGRLPANRQAFLPAMEQGIRELGIPVLNLEAPLAQAIGRGEDTHFAEDHHWNYRGAEIAAQATARWLRQALPDLPALPRHGGPGRVEVKPDSPNRSLIGLLKFRKGSPTEQAFLRPQAIQHFATGWKALLPDGAPAAGLILETSFGMFGFPQFLEQALGTRLDAVVTPGNGAAFPVAWFLAQHPEPAVRWPFVLWEIPEYHLLEGLDNHALGEPILLPQRELNPAAAEEIPPEVINLDGLSATQGGFEVIGREARVTLRFASPVNAVRIRFRCEGGQKRGQVSSPTAGRGGYLILPGTREAVDYDFHFAQAQTEVTLKLRFRDFGFTLQDWQVMGLRTARP